VQAGAAGSANCRAVWMDPAGGSTKLYVRSPFFLPGTRLWPSGFAEARRLYAQAGYSAAKNLCVSSCAINSGEVHKQRWPLPVASMWEGKRWEWEARLDCGRISNHFLQDIDSGDGLKCFRSSWFGDYNDAYTFRRSTSRATFRHSTCLAIEVQSMTSLVAEAAVETDAAKGGAQVLGGC